jgi:hypothetical protein
MSDLIQRIKRVAEGGNDLYAAERETLHEAIAALSAMQWTACAERMPEFRASYLVRWETYPDVEPEIAWFSGTGLFGRYSLGKQPTHWMPLPQPSPTKLEHSEGSL